MASLVRDASLTVRPGQSHLGGFGAADEVLDVLFQMSDTGVPPATMRG
jgi:hypothetical protein